MLLGRRSHVRLETMSAFAVAIAIFQLPDPPPLPPTLADLVAEYAHPRVAAVDSETGITLDLRFFSRPALYHNGPPAARVPIPRWYILDFLLHLEIQRYIAAFAHQ